MPIVEVLIPAAAGLIIQGIQAWIEMSRALGQTEEQIDAAFEEAKIRFNSKKASELPEA